VLSSRTVLNGGEQEQEQEKKKGKRREKRKVSFQVNLNGGELDCENASGTHRVVIGGGGSKPGPI